MKVEMNNYPPNNARQALELEEKGYRDLKIYSDDDVSWSYWLGVWVALWMVDTFLLLTLIARSLGLV